MENRDVLEQKLSELEAQKTALFEGGSDQAAVIRINEQIKAIQQQLSAIDAKEAIITEATNPESSFSLAAGGFEADFRALAAGEDEYQMLSVTTRLYLDQVEREHTDEIKTLNDSFHTDLASASEKNTALETELEQTRADLSDVRGKLEIANNQMTDLEIERDSAVKEAEALRKQVEELRLQITDKPKVANNLDGAGALAEINARIEAKKIPVYDVKDEFRSKDGTYTTFKLAETGEAGEIIWTSFKAKYRTLDDDQVSQFRAELEAAAAAKRAEEESIPKDVESVDPTEVGGFRDPIPAPEITVVQDTTVQEHTTNGEVATTPTPNDGGTVEERLTALELAVFGQVKAAA